MNRQAYVNVVRPALERLDPQLKESAINQSRIPITKPPIRPTSPGLADVKVASLKVLALTLLKQIESLESQTQADVPAQLNLQNEVHRFEAAMIRSALAKTGGRQRRAARLLGVKVTTLNTKIKRHKINMDQPASSEMTKAEPEVVEESGVVS